MTQVELREIHAIRKFLEVARRATKEKDLQRINMEGAEAKKLMPKLVDFVE